MSVVRALFVAGLIVSSGASTALEALVLEYAEWEVGGEPYAARALISPTYMRLDYGVDDGGFVLFDRRSSTIYSIQAEDQRILEISTPQDAAAEPGKPPVELLLTEDSYTDKEAPMVAGEPPVVTDYRVNGELCMQTVSVPGLLPEAVAAWREFAQLMAAQRATTLVNTPQEFWQDCSLANDIYAPTRYLQHGLPIREHSRSGISRELRGFDAAAVLPEDVFTLPQGFHRFRVGEVGQ